MGNCMGSGDQDRNESSGFDIQIALVKYIEWVKLMKERKESEIIKQQKNLVMLIRNSNRNRDQQFFKMRNIVNLCKELRVMVYQINYAAILRNNITRIKPQKNIDQAQKKDLESFEPYFQSLHYINTKKPSPHYQVVEQKFFSYIEVMLREDKITPEVLECFRTIVPTQAQLSQYMVEMCLRNDISQETLTKIGHKILPPKTDIQLYGIPMAVED